MPLLIVRTIFMLADHFRDIEALGNRLDELGRHL